MKTMKKRGFTLVELLVVIAILAILATVSVVGYTSFIERANVSNDQTLASQLNSMLTYMKADSNGDFYNVKIDENNIREVTKKVLEEGGLEELVPQSLDHGYNFYFDLQEGEYVVMKDTEAHSSAMNVILNAFADSSEYEVKLENSFTQGNRYFLVGTPNDKSPLSQIIDAFYSFDSTTDYAELKTLVDNTGIAGLIDYVSNSVIVTNDANYRLTDTPKHVIFADGLTQIGTLTKQWNSSTARFEDVSADNLATIEGTLTLPNSVEFLEGDSLNVGTDATVVINKYASVVAKMAFESFSDTTIKLIDGSFTTTNEGTITYIGKPVLTDGTLEYLLEYSNPMVNFSGTLNATTPNKVLDVTSANGTYAGYVAWDVGSFTITATGFVGVNSTIPATETEVVWTVADGYSEYITINGNTVSFTSNKPVDEIKIVGTATNSVGTVTREFTLNTVYINSVSYTLETQDVVANPDITLLYGGDGKTEYTLVQVATPNMTVDGITLSYGAKLTSNNNFTLTGETLALASDDVHGEQVVTVQPGEYSYLNKTVNITLYNANSLVFGENNSNILFVGDDNEITAGDLFSHNADHTIPEDAEIWLLTGLGNSSFGNMGSYTETLYADITKIPLEENWKETVIQFKDGSSDFTTANQADVVVAIVSADSNIRISANHFVTVVDGKNVHSISDLSSDVNNVLVSKLVADSTYAGFTLNSKVLYGNGFTIDLRGYDDVGTPTGTTETFETGVTRDVVSGIIEALITLNNATLNNVKVVGEVYKSSDFNYQDPTKYSYGSSLVLANGSSNIINCYLANTRSPLKTAGSVTVEDSVLFGGNYANIDITNSGSATTLTLKGNVTTINQVIDGVTDNTLGVGIVVDLLAHKDTTVTLSDCTLTQYNYVSKDDKSLLPIVSYSKDLGDMGKQGINVYLSSEINKVFTTDRYADWIFNQNNTQYFNFGVIFLNGVEYSTENVGTGFGAISGGAVKLAVDAILSSMFDDCQGDGDNFNNAPSGYAKEYTTVVRSATKANCKMTINANIYIHSPQNTVTFNNTVPNEYLPDTVLGE